MGIKHFSASTYQITVSSNSFPGHLVQGSIKFWRTYFEIVCLDMLYPLMDSLFIKSRLKFWSSNPFVTRFLCSILVHKNQGGEKKERQIMYKRCAEKKSNLKSSGFCVKVSLHLKTWSQNLTDAVPGGKNCVNCLQKNTLEKEKNGEKHTGEKSLEQSLMGRNAWSV